MYLRLVLSVYTCVADVRDSIRVIDTEQDAGDVPYR